MEFITLEKEASAEYVVQKSRFIGYAAPVESAEEAAAYVDRIRALHREARHNVFAYTLRSPAYSRFSDDGEPQGTAGKPVLEVIRKSGLEDCCVVVTRYFGGILLGTGGLVRAYSHAAKLAVEAASPVVMKACRVLRVATDYSFYSALLTLIPACGGVTEDTVFADKITITLRLPIESEPAFTKKLTELSMGKLTAEVLDEKFGRF